MDGVVPAYHPRLAGPCLSGRDALRGQCGGKGGACPLLPLTVPEVRRLLVALVESADRIAFHLAWSTFRRQHQAIAKRGHAGRRGQRPPQGDAIPAIHVLARHDFTLTDERWARIAPLLPPQQSARGRPQYDHRPLLAGMLWVVQTGAAWRELPAHFGPWHTVYSRYQRWRQDGIWQQILDALLTDQSPDAP